MQFRNWICPTRGFAVGYVKELDVPNSDWRGLRNGPVAPGVTRPAPRPRRTLSPRASCLAAASGRPARPTWRRGTWKGRRRTRSWTAAARSPAGSAGSCRCSGPSRPTSRRPTSRPARPGRARVAASCNAGWRAGFAAGSAARAHCSHSRIHGTSQLHGHEDAVPVRRRAFAVLSATRQLEGLREPAVFGVAALLVEQVVPGAAAAVEVQLLEPGFAGHRGDLGHQRVAVAIALE